MKLEKFLSLAFMLSFMMTTYVLSSESSKTDENNQNIIVTEVKNERPEDFFWNGCRSFSKNDQLIELKKYDDDDFELWGCINSESFCHQCHREHQFNLYKTKETIRIAQKVLDEANEDDIIIFPGRTMVWVHETLKLMAPKHLIFAHAFSGAPYVYDKVTKNQEIGFRKYCTSLGLTPDILKGAKGKIIVSDYLQKGNGIMGWVETFDRWCQEEGWNDLKSNLKILGCFQYTTPNSFLYNMREDFNEFLNKNKTIKLGWIYSNLFPLFAGGEDNNDDDNRLTSPISLLPYFPKSEWAINNYKSVLNYKRHPYALEILKQLKSCYETLVNIKKE